MKADAISQKILNDARAAAAQTLSEARDRAAEMRQAAERRIEEKRSSLDAETARDCDVLRSRMLRMAELEQRKALLSAKREVIDAVFDTALMGMRAMPGEQRAEYNKKLLLEAAEGGEQLLVAEGEAALFNEKFLKAVNAALKKDGKAPVSLSEERRETGGGFILKSGGLEINCTYQAVLAEARPALEAEVARMLFEDVS